MIVGFAWGGWVTGRTSRKLAEDVADDAVTERLALICVAQFNQDPGKAAKLEALNQASSYERRNYVQDQGWATMPGEESPDPIRVGDYRVNVRYETRLPDDHPPVGGIIIQTVHKDIQMAKSIYSRLNQIVAFFPGGH